MASPRPRVEESRGFGDELGDERRLGTVGREHRDRANRRGLGRSLGRSHGRRTYGRKSLGRSPRRRCSLDCAAAGGVGLAGGRGEAAQLPKDSGCTLMVRNLPKNLFLDVLQFTWSNVLF